MIKTLQLNTWYKIEDYIEFKNLIYKYISKIHKVNNISGIIGDSKSYRCVEHICEEQRIEYIKILELHFDCIRYTTKIPDCETYIAITGSPERYGGITTSSEVTVPIPVTIQPVTPSTSTYA